jgi:pyridoxine 4-dehydrogenase
MQRLQPLIDELRKIGIARGNKTPSQVALNWCIAKGTLPIPGAKNERQATENAGALGWSLTPNEILQIEEKLKKI